MITAKKSKPFKYGFSLVLLPLFKRSFHRLLGQKLSEPPDKPVLFIANHSSWWDGLLFFLLNERIWRQDIHIMMDEAGLQRFSFFRWLGAFSVDRTRPKDIMESLRYAKALLDGGKSVILFPQGAEQHLETRPLTFQSGVTYLMEKCPDVPVVPISFYYSFGRERKPDIWVHQHPPLSLADLEGTTRTDRTAALQTHFTALLDAQREDVIAGNEQAYKELAVKWKW